VRLGSAAAVLGAALLTTSALSSAASARDPAYPFPGFIVSRAVANYRAIMGGSKRLEDLSAIELREVREIQREIRAAHADPRTSREQCIAEQTAARGGELSDLAARIVDLACSQR
jgi:hypothetical protein